MEEPLLRGPVRLNVALVAVIGLVACLFCLPSVAGAQATPAPSPDRAKVMAAAQEVMQKARYCGLVTVGQDGHPQARVVDPLPPERDLTVWIATNPVTRKVGQIRADPRVTLFYFDPSGPGYVTLLAKAELVSDPAEKARHWKEEWAPFYSDKTRGEDFILIRCKPFRLELASYAHGLLNDPKTWRPITLDLP
jgi:general stress protein 26